MEFKEENVVFLRIPNTRYGALKDVTNTKLAHQYYEPYKVLRRVGEVAYQLELPTTTRIHDVFHVSHLKAYLGPEVHV